MATRDSLPLRGGLGVCQSIVGREAAVFGTADHATSDLPGGASLGYQTHGLARIQAQLFHLALPRWNKSESYAGITPTFHHSLDLGHLHAGSDGGKAGGAEEGGDADLA